MHFAEPAVIALGVLAFVASGAFLLFCFFHNDSLTKVPKGL